MPPTTAGRVRIRTQRHKDSTYIGLPTTSYKVPGHCGEQEVGQEGQPLEDLRDLGGREHDVGLGGRLGNGEGGAGHGQQADLGHLEVSGTLKER